MAHDQPISKIFTSEAEMLGVIEKASFLFYKQGIEGERFAVTIARIGFEEVERQLLSNELLERKEQIVQD